MLTLPRGVRIYLAREPVDMRKGIDGLSALVRQFGEDVFSGHLFVFISKRGDRLKILTWEATIAVPPFRQTIGTQNLSPSPCRFTPSSGSA